MAVYKITRYDVELPSSHRPNVACDVEKYINNKKTFQNGKKKQGDKKKQQPRQRRPTARDGVVKQKRGGTLSVSGLSECAAKFALAISDPFNPRATGVCIPIPPVLRTQKVARFLRTQFVTGASGVGFVLLSPSTASDTGSVYTTTSAYAESGITTRGTGAGAINIATGVTCNPVPGPWTSTNLQAVNSQDHVGARMVCAGVNAQYSGPLLNQGGVFTSLVQPNHDGFPVSYTPGSSASIGLYSSYKEAYWKPNCGQKVTLSAVPVNNVEETFSQQSTVTESGAITNDGQLFPYTSADPFTINLGGNFTIETVDPMMGIIVSGAVPGSLYVVEIVYHCEYTGRPVAAVATSGEADYLGYQKVSAAALKLPEELGNKASSYGDQAINLMGMLIDKQEMLARATTTLASIAGQSYRAFKSPGLRRLN